VACVEESRTAYRVLIGNLRRPLGGPRGRWEDNIKVHLKEIGLVGSDWINLTCGRVS
jgi:hypothetical protein